MACAAALLAGVSGAHAQDAASDDFESSAAAVSTTPRQLTKPKSGSNDYAGDPYFSAIGTKKGALLGWTVLRAQPFEITANVQRIGADGKLDGKPAKLEAGILEGMPKFADLGGDKFAVVWKSAGPSFKGAIVDAGNGKTGKPVSILASQAASFAHDPAKIGKDKLAVVARRAPGFLDEDTILVILNAKTMKPIGSPKIIEDDVPGPFGLATWEQTITAYDGGAVALFRNKDSQVTGVPVDAKGKTGKPFQVNSTTLRPFAFASSYTGYRLRGKALDNGGYVVAWAQHDAGSDLPYDIRARVFDRKGKPVGPDFFVNQDLVANQEGPEILPLKKGFAVAWTDRATLGYVTQVIRYFDDGGKPISDELVTQYFLDSGAAAPSTNYAAYARLPKDAYLKIYGSNTTSGAALFADGLPAPRIGSDAGETLKGGRTADVILARGGDDKISGGDGDDTIDAGAGNDTVDGGDGADLIVPGAGNDELTGGDGPDIFVFRPGGGEDVILDFASEDRIDVSAFHYNQHATALSDAVQDGLDVVFTLKDRGDPSAPQTVVRLKKRTLGQVTAANIIL